MPVDIHRTQLVFEGDDKNLKNILNSTARALENIEKLASDAGKKGFASDEMAKDYKEFQRIIEQNDKKLRGMFKGATDGYTMMELALSAVKEKLEKTGDTDAFNKLDKAAKSFLNTLRQVKSESGDLARPQVNLPATVPGGGVGFKQGFGQALTKLPGIGGILGKLGVGGGGAGMGLMGTLGLGLGGLGVGALGFGVSRAMAGYGRFRELMPTRVGAYGRMGPVGFEALRQRAAAPEMGFMPEEYYQQAEQLAPTLGGQQVMPNLRGIQQMARGTGMSVGEIGQMMGRQVRAGIEPDAEKMKRTFAAAVTLGVDRARLSDYMQGVLDLQEQSARFGMQQDTARQFFQTGIAATRGDRRQQEMFLGQRGAEFAGRFTGMFRSAGMGAGDPFSALLLRQAGLGTGASLVEARERLQQADPQDMFRMLRGIRGQFGGRGSEAWRLTMQERGFTGFETKAIDKMLDKPFAKMTKEEKEKYDKFLAELKDPKAPDIKALESIANAQARSLDLGERMVPIATFMKDSIASIDSMVEGIAKAMGVKTESKQERTARTAKELYSALPEDTRTKLYEEAQARVAAMGKGVGKEYLTGEGVMKYAGGVSRAENAQVSQETFLEMVKLYAEGNLKLTEIAEHTKNTADGVKGKGEGAAMPELINGMRSAAHKKVAGK